MSSSTPLPFPTYFEKLSKIYPKQTSNSTLSIFKQTLPDIDPPITATSAIVPHITPQEIQITDSVPAMVDAATDLISTQHWEYAKASVMDSQAFTFSDGAFTHSITNFSIFTFQDAAKSVHEIYRTIRPSGGVALVSTWKRFGVIEVVHRAQKAVRPDPPLMKVPHPEFTQEGYLEGMIVEAGFEKGKVKVLEKSVVVTGEERDGLVDFMAGHFTAPARNGWTDEEVAGWGNALEDAVLAEERDPGGVRFDTWVVIARK